MSNLSPELRCPKGSDGMQNAVFVEKHRQRIMKKLGVHKATELVRFAITKGIVNVGAY